MDFARDHAPGWSNSDSSTEPASAAHEWSPVSGVADLFSRQPLLLGLVGVAIGASLATAFASTETEKRLLGEARDALKAKGAESLASGLKQVEEAGLTPEAAADAARTVVSKVAGVVQQTSDDVVRRVRS
jgi:hypothetical protein